MAKSRTQINEAMRKKTNSLLVEAIFLAKKNRLDELASAISVPTRLQATVNVGKLNETKGDSAIIPGKVLSNGEVNKKIKVYALNFSDTACEKLKKAGCEAIKILDALRKGEKIRGEIIR